jgi:hypothetical protein
MYGLPWLPGDLQAAFLNGQPVTCLITRKTKIGTQQLTKAMQADIWVVHNTDTGVYSLSKNRIGSPVKTLTVEQVTELLLYTVQWKGK